MKPKHVILIALLIFLAIIGWDVYLYSDNIEGNSITQVVRGIIKDNPLASAALGFLFGALFIHFTDFTSQKKTEDEDAND